MKKNTLIIFSLIIFNSFLLNSCTNSNICKNYVENVFRKQNYDLKIIDKYSYDRYYRIIGISKNGQKDTTEEGAVRDDLFKQAEIGDTLLKESGKLELYLKKRDTIIEYPCYCNGKRIE